MRILHFVPYLTKGGVAEVWMNLTKALAALGCEIYLIGPYANHLEDYVNLYEVSKTVSMRIPDPFYTLAYVQMNKRLIEEVLRREHVDVLLTHGPLAAVCLEGNIMSKVKCYSIVHGTYSNEVKWMKFHPMRGQEKLLYMLGISLSHYHDMKLYSFLSRRGVRFIAVSSKTKEELVNAGVSKNSAYSILNGIDKHFFRPLSKDEAKSYLEDKFNIKTDGLMIAHIGLSPRKGTHVLLKALALLKRKGVKFSALLIGETGPKTYRQYLERMIETLNLKDYIKMLEFISSTDLLHVYNAADVTVVPSYSEGSPLVIPESLACGTPVIATDVGGNAEYLSKVHLDALIVKIEKYDTSNAIFQKLTEYIENYQQYKKHIEPSKIPSQTDIAIEYMEVMLQET
ncbi:MAG: glycosyltransferase family 4 protein [Candidatus Nezhaarchaeales archaeon]